MPMKRFNYRSNPTPQAVARASVVLCLFPAARAAGRERYTTARRMVN